MSILRLEFNRANSRLVCCTTSGFKVYTLDPNIEKKFNHKTEGGIGIGYILRNTNILALVGGGEDPWRSSDLLIIFDDQNKSPLVALDMKKPIKNAILSNGSGNDEKIITVLEKDIVIFAGFNQGNFYTRHKTFQNENGICKIYDEDGALIIVTLGPTEGDILVWNVNQDNKRIINAHRNKIQCIAISNDGTKIATASESGTNIHIYDTETLKEICQVRRGSSTKEIYDMSFSRDNKYIACCSGGYGYDTTVHIFELFKNKEETKNVKSMFSVVGDYVPTYLGSKYFESEWSFKQHYLRSTAKTKCGFDEKNILHVVTYDGKYFRISGDNFDVITSDNLHPDSD